jgi:hypothetical protein
MLVLGVVVCGGAARADSLKRTVIDSCDDAAVWEIRAADGVRLSTSVVPGNDKGMEPCGGVDRGGDGDPNAKALRIDYDFSRGSGYGIIRRAVTIALPENYRFTWKMRGDGPRNTLEFKLVEPEAPAVSAASADGNGGGAAQVGAVGENVWWVNQTNFAFPCAWTEMSLPKRKFSFAWGPSGGVGGKPREAIRWIEIAITSFNGGKGTVWLDELAIEELPVAKPYDGVPVVSVSSAPAGTLGPSRIEPDGSVNWTSHERDVTPTITIDFGTVRSFGGLHVRWKPTARRSGGAGEGGTGVSGVCGYLIQASSNGTDWSTLRRYSEPGAEQVLRCPDTSTRYLRLAGWLDVHHVGEGSVTLTHLHVLPLEFADDPNGVALELAKTGPRGTWPRQMVGQGVYWTIIGSTESTREVLISEDGEIEVDKAGPSLHPFIIVDEPGPKRLLHWANARTTTQQLADGGLPLPSVRREYDGLTLTVEAVDASHVLDERTFVRYRIKNIGAERVSGRLAVALRPLQVNPAYQFLNTAGGVAPIHEIRSIDGSVFADRWEFRALTPGSRFYGESSANGEIVFHLLDETFSGYDGAIDNEGMASGAWTKPFMIAPGSETDFVLMVGVDPYPMSDESFGFTPPLTAPELYEALQRGELVRRSIGKRGVANPDEIAHGRSRPSETAEEATRTFVSASAAGVDAWKRRLNAVQLDLPSLFGKQIADSVRANLAYILINKDGPGIQPGSRSYERTWIRDGTLTSAALLSFGFENEVRAFLDWFAPFQYNNGKIPCCVDQRGPDPVAENDSHGQYIHAVMRYYQHTHDAAFLANHWPHVLKAIDYMVFLRNQRTTDEFRNGIEEKRAFYGLLPESISHEGYSAKPMHSYWDMLFAVRGVSDARAMAELMNDQPNIERLRTLEREFSKSLVDSYTLAMKLKKIDYLPGCVELGDFDATSTTVALYPCDQGDVLPHEALVNTFEKFYAFFKRRRDGVEDWVNYTPYEHRIVGAMILLGWRERAHELWHWYFQHQRPAGWHHWAEVVWKDPRTPKFIGDMPHTWVGSDFINSVRLMLAYERHADESLVLGAGLPLEWLLDSEGVKIGGLRTIYGTVSYRTQGHAASGVVTIDVDLMPEPPRGGVEFSLPSPDRITSVVMNGELATHTKGSVRIPDVKRATRLEVRYSMVAPVAP